ncbi:MAG: 4Fe-4S binding protein [Candidatus Omnitrophica bacterium]|jgi:2-oxoglutarate ferredoxin oxidoreductase subunit delta|nr:4Fe-4S binding protein [Candidatus Omnitrophota bacterium]MDD4013027.1 4Fe-4S binding protein [Candidatus Omnitrophota bacterium]
MSKRTRIKIDPERCKGCLFCITVCNFKVLALSEKVNKRGMAYVEVVDPEKCRGCGLCAIMCPECCIEITEE